VSPECGLHIRSFRDDSSCCVFPWSGAPVCRPCERACARTCARACALACCVSWPAQLEAFSGGVFVVDAAPERLAAGVRPNDVLARVNGTNVKRASLEEVMKVLQALRSAVLCCAVLCCAVLCCAVLCCAVLCYCVLCCERGKECCIHLLCLYPLYVRMLRVCARCCFV
jgi:hypothetical protein